MTASQHHTWLEVETGSVEVFEFCGGTLTHFSERCPTRELSPNEDAACAIQVSDRSAIIAVADGMGGANSGNRASKAVIKGLTRTIRNLQQVAEIEESLRPAILDGIDAANQEILSWKIGAGSTLTVIEIAAGTLRTYHIGDTKAMLVSNRGRIKFATVGHAPVAQAVDIGMLNEKEALLHDDRNLISNCIGSDEMKIEIGPSVKMSARDTLLVASDGLFDNLATAEICSIVRTGSLETKTRALVQLASDRMNETSVDALTPSKPDDLTIIGFRQF